MSRAETLARLKEELAGVNAVIAKIQAGEQEVRRGDRSFMAPGGLRSLRIEQRRLLRTIGRLEGRGGVRQGVARERRWR